MDAGKITTWMDQAQPILVAFGLEALGEIAVFVAGRWLTSLATRLIGAIAGTVRELGLGLFGTTPTALDNVKTIVGNGKIMGGDIKNYSAHPYPRVELFAQLAGSADAHMAIALLQEAVSKVANATRAPAVHADPYWQVYFDTKRSVADTLGAADFPVATRPVTVYPVQTLACFLTKNVPAS